MQDRMSVSDISKNRIVTVEIRKVGFSYRIVIHGMMLKRRFFAYSVAQDYLSTIADYFGSGSSVILKEVA